jgi:hypothetical protein
MVIMPTSHILHQTRLCSLLQMVFLLMTAGALSLAGLLMSAENLSRPSLLKRDVAYVCNDIAPIQLK